MLWKAPKNAWNSSHLATDIRRNRSVNSPTADKRLTWTLDNKTLGFLYDPYESVSRFTDIKRAQQVAVRHRYRVSVQASGRCCDLYRSRTCCLPLRSPRSITGRQRFDRPLSSLRRVPCNSVQMWRAWVSAMNAFGLLSLMTGAFCIAPSHGFRLRAIQVFVIMLT